MPVGNQFSSKLITKMIGEKQMKVLVVDDNMFITMSLKTYGGFRRNRSCGDEMTEPRQ